MNELTVTTKDGRQSQFAFRSEPNQNLTPSLARRAMETAYGYGATGQVVDHKSGVGYKVYRNSCRKFQVEL